MTKQRKNLKTYKEWQKEGYQVKRNVRAIFSHNNKPLFTKDQVYKKRSNKSVYPKSNPNQDYVESLIGILGITVILLTCGMIL